MEFDAGTSTSVKHIKLNSKMRVEDGLPNNPV